MSEHSYQDSPETHFRRLNWDAIRTWLILALMVGGIAWYYFHNHHTTIIQRREAERRQQQSAACVAALASKYNAVTNWEALLPDRGEHAQWFSIDVAKALLGSEKRPVLITCNISDIAEQDGKLIASLTSVETTNSLSIEVECDSDQIKTFSSTNWYPIYAVVFRCLQVQRLKGGEEGFSVKGKLWDAAQLSHGF